MLWFLRIGRWGFLRSDLKSPSLVISGPSNSSKVLPAPTRWADTGSNLPTRMASRASPVMIAVLILQFSRHVQYNNPVPPPPSTYCLHMALYPCSLLGTLLKLWAWFVIFFPLCEFFFSWKGEEDSLGWTTCVKWFDINAVETRDCINIEQHVTNK